MLYSSVEKYYSLDLQDFEISDQLKIELVEFKQWYHFDALGRVVSEIYSQVEQQEF